ncbi:MAG: Hpt domain-containing protein [Anaerovoracaceae bacterium]
MTIQEFYQAAGGNEQDVLDRMMSLKLIRKFTGKFLEDDSYMNLCQSIAAGNRQEAFRAAHTLKGVCQNLGFGKLQTSAGAVTELLRPESDSLPEGIEPLMEEVKQDYEVLTDAIRTWLASEQ